MINFNIDRDIHSNKMFWWEDFVYSPYRHGYSNFIKDRIQEDLDMNVRVDTRHTQFNFIFETEEDKTIFMLKYA